MLLWVSFEWRNFGQCRASSFALGCHQSGCDESAARRRRRLRRHHKIITDQQPQVVGPISSASSLSLAAAVALAVALDRPELAGSFLQPRGSLLGRFSERICLIWLPQPQPQPDKPAREAQFVWIDLPASLCANRPAQVHTSLLAGSANNISDTHTHDDDGFSPIKRSSTRLGFGFGLSDHLLAKPPLVGR